MMCGNIEQRDQSPAATPIFGAHGPARFQTKRWQRLFAKKPDICTERPPNTTIHAAALI